MLEAVLTMAIVYTIAMLFGQFVWLPIIKAIERRKLQKAETWSAANRKHIFKGR